MDSTDLLWITLPAAFVAAIAGFIAYRLHRNARLRSRAAFIQGYRFPPELRNRLQANTGLTLEQSGRVLEGLRQYFLACLAAQRRPIAKEVGMPSKAVDAAWHEFIVITKEYKRFCEQAFGRYLHHTPKAMMDEPTSAAVANTLHQLKQPALTPAGWAMVGSMPLIFALDRELAFKDGYNYDTRAMVDVECQRQALIATQAGSSGAGDSGSSGGWGGSGGSDNCGDSGGGGSCGGGGGCGGS